MRGTLQLVNRLIRSQGIIPAHAGNTVYLAAEAPLVGDHPRACGEHYSSIGEELAEKGSSPRMRGTHV